MKKTIEVYNTFTLKQAILNEVTDKYKRARLAKWIPDIFDVHPIQQLLKIPAGAKIEGIELVNKNFCFEYEIDLNLN